MFKSIRWTLLFWYGLILVLVIVGFGATLYFQLGHSMRAARDTKLREWAQTIARALEPRRGGSFEVRLPQEYARVFHDAEPNGPYFVVWDAFGHVAAQSRGGLDLAQDGLFRTRDLDEEQAEPPPRRPPPRTQGDGDGRRPPPPRRPRRKEWEHQAPSSPIERTRGSMREAIVRGEFGTTVLVGQSGEDDRRRLREFLMMVLAAGGGALGLALVGGWFLAEWALAPIARMSEAASSITTSNLSRRIDMTRTESELGRLATILNETFDRLEEAFLRQNRFTADASHELRTPLAVVIAHAELALRKERTPAEYRTMFESCLKAAQRMRTVVEGLLTLTRADADELSVVSEPFDLAALVEESAEMLQPLAASRGLSFETTAQPVEVIGDRERLREVVNNVITNAIRYNRDAGAVNVRLRREGNMAVLEVADTGIGIPEKDHPYVFERFYRADPARSRQVGGCGLGLAISKWIVEAHGGTIKFSSREGQGTTFTVRLPLAPGRDDPFARPEQAEAATSQSH